ncbi:MAG: thiamine-phosphate kinase [Candidatus Nanopelagicales bacterium]|jgi:thiamine-monophosphate kinase|nr:thiamine-phosphate kinase [Actinomycetota bacterium]HNL50656.1 thiamine-phosphate kinase [Actinomycetota bacterium]HNO15313.1 thiamine-phosphate kinase [Actinomycetota bacterium]HUM87242.1 thiamine-phosphate kinase [Actinomycetota bacterium]
MSGQTVADLGEFGLIAALQSRLKTAPAVDLPSGDDAAVLRLGSDRLVVSTDMLVQDRHFRLEWSSPEDIGHKAAAQNFADLAAMGARPVALTAAIAMPPETPAEWVLAVVDGMVAEAADLGSAVVGGDVTRGSVITLCVTALGVPAGSRLVRRNGAHPGDVVAVCGRLGWAAAGLAVLGRGFRSPRVVVDAHRRPQPPYSAGALAAAAGATAMIDVSDGLLADLGHIAHASGVQIVLDTDALPIDDQIRETASAFNADPLGWVIAGGDDHALAATFPAGTVLPAGFVAIGEVVEGSGVEVPGYRHIGSPGFDHFRD